MINVAENVNTIGIINQLTELRSRLIYCSIALMLIFIPLYCFSNTLYYYVAIPLLTKLSYDGHLIATSITAPFLVPLKLTFALSFFITAPFILYQLWSFIAPGLYQQERHIAILLLFSSIILFYSGILFAYFIVFPLLFGFFAGIVPQGVAFTPDIGNYLDFVLRLFFVFGIAFETPIAILLCVFSGITTAEALSKKRVYFIIAAFTLGMLLTPPDIISQILLAIPICLLFEIGIILARIIPKKSVSYSNP